jgi:hypothetical protein
MTSHRAVSVERDATERAFRTWMQGLLVDLAAGVGVALVAGVAGGIEWTRVYWVTLGLAVAKSCVMAFVSYFARRMVPPASTVPEQRD